MCLTVQQTSEMASKKITKHKWLAAVILKEALCLTKKWLETNGHLCGGRNASKTHHYLLEVLSLTNSEYIGKIEKINL